MQSLRPVTTSQRHAGARFRCRHPGLPALEHQAARWWCGSVVVDADVNVNVNAGPWRKPIARLTGIALPGAGAIGDPEPAGVR